MITNLYYYNYYKPHIIKNSKVQAVKQNPILNRSQNTDKPPVNMSKAYNKDVLSYVNELSGTVNTVRVASTGLGQAFAKVTKNKNDKSGKTVNTDNQDDSNKDDVIIGMEDLATALNKSDSFKNTASQSKIFDKYSQDVKELVNSHMDKLESLGFKVDNGKYTVDPTVLENTSLDKVSSDINSAKDLVKQISTKTTELLQVPMSKHMEFKSFSYYFNYASGMVTNNSLGVIGTGAVLHLQL